jgi:hypothetical protein
MAETLFLAFSNPADPNKEDEFNEWYDQHHIPQLLEHVPGFISAQRFRLDSAQLPHRYLAIYEVQGEPDAVMKDLRERGADGSVEISPLLQRDPAPIAIFVTAMGAKITA